MEIILKAMKIELTAKQKIALEEPQRQSRDHNVRDRIRCVLLSSEGWSPLMTAQSQHIHETMVRRHLNPIERLWKVMNDELFVHTLPTTLSRRINDNYHTLENASSS
jgi:hypothetical protein